MHGATIKIKWDIANFVTITDVKISRKRPIIMDPENSLSWEI
jgi:hypothetical protein